MVTATGVSWRIYRPESDREYPVGLDVVMNFATFQDAPKTSSFYDNGVKLRSVDTMLSDIRSGNLPSVSWIMVR